MIPVHTIMEVYRVGRAMQLVRVLPSAQDEVNAAAFHPFKVPLLTPTRAPPVLCNLFFESHGSAVHMHW